MTLLFSCSGDPAATDTIKLFDWNHEAYLKSKNNSDSDGRLTLENVRMFKMPSNSCFSLFAKQYVVQNNKTIL